MKKLASLFLAFLLCTACADSKKIVTITVVNPIGLERTGEMIEIAMSTISEKLQLADTAQLMVLDADGQQIPYQVTSDETLIFPVSVGAADRSVYTIQQGSPKPFDVIACGKHYPERLDDVAWENDLVAFRAYGPALQANGEQGFGYDVFTKYNTTQPVVEARYAMELDSAKRARIAELKNTDPQAAKELQNSISYHVDHGNGMDCYSVGPTLGGGTAALLAGDSIIYPYCYRTYEILDNGPLRFSVRLVFNPLTVRGDSGVIETRLITLDAGSHLNKTVVSYTHLKEAIPIATGIVLHEPDGAVVTDAADGYITYVDPTSDPKAGNGKIFMGAAFPAQVKEAKVVLFSEKEKKELRAGADGHVLAIADYEPGSEYTYYWGAAWDKADIKSPEAWNEYMAQFAKKIRTPLEVIVQ